MDTTAPTQVKLSSEALGDWVCTLLNRYGSQLDMDSLLAIRYQLDILFYRRSDLQP